MELGHAYCTLTYSHIYCLFILTTYITTCMNVLACTGEAIALRNYTDRFVTSWAVVTTLYHRSVT